MKKYIVIVLAAAVALTAIVVGIWGLSSGSGSSSNASNPTGTSASGTEPQQTTPESTGCSHVYSVSTEDATCTESGYTEEVCTLCGETVSTTLDALGHSFTVFTSNGDASCEADGTKTAQCDRCEETQTVADEGSATGHVYTDTVVEPTCITQGYTTHTCVCGKTYSDTFVGAPGHNYVISTIQATCEQQGYTRYTCSACAHSYKTNYVEAYGHSYSNWSTTAEPTCDTDGLRQRVCGNCANVENEILSALGHDYTQWQVMEETVCADAVEKLRSCNRCGGEEVWLDLSQMPLDQLQECAANMALRTGITHVELMKEEGTSLFAVADVVILAKAAPQAVFNYSFTLFGKSLNASAERVEFVNAAIGNEGEQQIRAALDILTSCSYFLLDNCGLSNEVLAEIRDDYPETKVVWRVFQTNKNRSWLTDTLVLRAVYGINNTNSGVLKYLTEVKYMDLGHNTSMTDLSFCAYMPNLEIAILSGSPITDLSPLGNCKKLEFLEVAWCGYLRDLTPLAECDSLKYLNVGHTKVTDFSPIYDLDIQMLSYVNSGNRVGFTAEDWAVIQANMPDCWITYAPLADNNASPYGIGWRYKEGWAGYTDIYKKVREVFNYDYIDSLLKG